MLVNLVAQVSRIARTAARRAPRGPIAAALLLLILSCRSIPEIPSDLSTPGPTCDVDGRDGSFAVFGDPQQSPVLDWFMKSGPKYRHAVRDHLKLLDADLIFLAG